MAEIHLNTQDTNFIETMVPEDINDKLTRQSV